MSPGVLTSSSVCIRCLFTVYLGVNDNRLEGPLPSELGLLWNMTRLQIQKNQFTGNLPDSWGRMAQLEQLMAEGNKLGGTIPNTLCELTKDVLRQFIVDCVDKRRGLGYNCEPKCCTLCRDVN